MKLKEWIESIKLALSFLTIIPFKSDYSPSILRKSLYFFSLSGIATGCIMFFAAKIASIFNPINFFLYASIILLAEYLTSNFFHIDGYCDCSDALYFTKQGKDKHKILKDPHIGMYAASLLFFLFIIKIGLMISVVQNNYLKLLLLYPVSGYIPAFIQTLFFKPMFEEGLGNSLKKEISFK
ncbi:adenosylcobinamide-GDP ribazoletransferase, partial [Candidatus Dependentiae bacterium]|nr:adenosylcobinamide-GDP ribazoletransferase [Candidatus Dependentiae bacterium]